MKTCSTCKIEKIESEFNKKSSMKDGLERYCKQCHRARNQKHYEDKKQDYKDSARKWKQEKLEWWKEYKQQFRCSICNETRTWCIDFHHTDPSVKEASVSSMVTTNRSKEQIIEEISKCIPVCRNCHADIHYKLRLGVV